MMPPATSLLHSAYIARLRRRFISELPLHDVVDRMPHAARAGLSCTRSEGTAWLVCAHMCGPLELYCQYATAAENVGTDAKPRAPGVAFDVLRVASRTPFLWGIWVIEALNYLVHVVWRPVQWNVFSQAAGYFLWAMQLASFARCQLVTVPEVSDEWRKRATAGLESSTVCPRTGQLLPPRSRYVRRADAVVLGFDHYCFWLGTPIGLHNRKHFILFISYSAAFCVMGSAHSLYELIYALPARMRWPAFPWHIERPLVWRHPTDPSWSALLYAGLEWLSGGAHGRHGWFVGLFVRAAQPDGPGLWYTCGLFASALINPVLGCFLLGFSLFQIWIVLHNRTSLDVDDRYDVGYSQNWRQVFGGNWWLWSLPVDAAQRDVPWIGYLWPLNPSATVGLSRHGRYERPNARRTGSALMSKTD